jgi:hypothetical protein
MHAAIEQKTNLNQRSLTMKKDITIKLNVTGTSKESPSYKVTVDFNFDNCSREQLEDWALSNRIVVFQNSNRDMTVDEFMSLDNTTMDVSLIGNLRTKKTKVRPMTFDEQMNYIKGLPEDEKARAIEQLMGMIS